MRSQVAPTTRVFNALVPVYAHQGPLGVRPPPLSLLTRQIFDLFRDMTALGVSPDSYTFNLAISALLNINEADKALALLPIMVLPSPPLSSPLSSIYLAPCDLFHSTDSFRIALRSPSIPPPSPPSSPTTSPERTSSPFKPSSRSFGPLPSSLLPPHLVQEMQRRAIRPSSGLRSLLAEVQLEPPTLGVAPNDKAVFRQLLAHFI